MVSAGVMILCCLFTLIFRIALVSIASVDAQSSFKTTDITDSQNMSGVNQTRFDLVLNPNFTFFNETTGLPTNWNDPSNNCKSLF